MPLPPNASRFRGRYSRFRVTSAAATPAAIGQLHHEFAAWIGDTVHTTDGRRSDIILVVYEALASTAETVDTGPAQLSITARYSHKTRSLHVCVHARRTWLYRVSRLPSTRDLGLDIIHALCDQPVFTSTSSGTEVDLRWNLFA
ncbi:UNVERIFIED_CONTAM: hypothetical protein DES50_107157 [Williamsia faeni]